MGGGGGGGWLEDRPFKTHFFITGLRLFITFCASVFCNVKVVVHEQWYRRHCKCLCMTAENPLWEDYPLKRREKCKYCTTYVVPRECEPVEYIPLLLVRTILSRSFTQTVGLQTVMKKLLGLLIGLVARVGSGEHCPRSALIPFSVVKC
jgi:hypothetical protein